MKNCLFELHSSCIPCHTTDDPDQLYILNNAFQSESLKEGSLSDYLLDLNMLLIF